MPTYIYPALGAMRDLYVVRLSGVGIGNALFPYLRAMIVAERTGAQLVWPAWPSFKSGPFLRREAGKRTYVGLFRPYADALTGVAKLRPVLFGRAVHQRIDWIDDAVVQPGRLNVIASQNYMFDDLRPHRDRVRRELLAMLSRPRPDVRWGAEDFIAVHVRLGDFGAAQIANDRYIGNARLPLDWYCAAIARARAMQPGLPVKIVSDGSDAELAPLLVDGVSRLRAATDIDELLALATARVLVGSNSTFSRWAAYLGNPEAVWSAGARFIDNPAAGDRRTEYLPA